ncbi:MAG TPA: ABC transporter ATP-binding protein [Bacillota bacterium]|nr:ABC transporter ATP-binding protein [Bacillota bacterium]
MSVFEEELYSKKVDFTLWKQLLRYAKPYTKQLVFLVFINVLTGIVDVFFPMMNRYAIDNFIVKGSLDGLGWYAALYGLLVAVQCLNVWFLISVAGKVEVFMVYDIRKAGFKHLQKLSFSYYDKTPVGWIMARMTSDAQRLGETISWGLVDLAWGFSMMIGIIIVMFSLNLRLALIALAVVPLLVVISLYFQKRILGGYRDVRKTNSRITGAFNEGIMGAKTTKTLVREEGNLEEFKDITGSMKAQSIRVAITSSIFMPIVTTLGGIGLALVLWQGGEGLLGQNPIIGVISLGTLYAFITYTLQFFEPIGQIARIFAELQSAQASAERVFSMINTPLEIDDSPGVRAKYGDSFNPKRDKWEQVGGDIAFENVSFAYKGGDQVLEDFSLKVKAGETIALVGETGSGKSTIVNLICRFYEPTGGQILIDGKDYRERSQLWLQSNLGYVLQAPHLFSGSIKDNIRYGKLDATDEEIEAAARLVNAHDFISRLDKGYDTEVGEGGGRMSTGQKQLVSFARAVVANPKLFVLDEATSSIDTETEQIIQTAIQKVLEGRTSFIIAHRLSTIRSADRILVIVDGRVIEEGSHKDLLGKKGYYYRLYTNQFLEEEGARILKKQ